jgi:hypothetical protein
MSGSCIVSAQILTGNWTFRKTALNLVVEKGGWGTLLLDASCEGLIEEEAAIERVTISRNWPEILLVRHA